VSSNQSLLHVRTYIFEPHFDIHLNVTDLLTTKKHPFGGRYLVLNKSCLKRILQNFKKLMKKIAFFTNRTIINYRLALKNNLFTSRIMSMKVPNSP
jgi:hypothetical protein